MKKIMYYILIVFGLSVISCGEDFLDLQPPSSIVVDALYKTDSDFDQAILGSYSGLRASYGGFYQVGDLRADDMWQEMLNHTARVLTDIYTGHVHSNNIWLNGYVTIHRANSVLQQIENMDVPNKSRYIGEAKFLRALAYFNIVRTHGAAPMLLEPVLPADAYFVGRTPVNTIYDEVIIPGFIEASNALPAQYSGASVGRATRGAAKAMLGKVYLTRGNFALAETTLKEVTDMGYSLLDDYNDIFDWDNNKHHSEYIFEIEYSSEPGIAGSGITSTFAQNTPIFRQIWGMSGTLSDSGTPTWELYNLFEEGDSRHYISATDGVFDNEGVWQPLSDRLASLVCLKYAAEVPSDNNSSANWIVTRYGDVILMLAEAKNENGKIDEAHEYLNKIRERAGVEPRIGLTQSEMRDAIELERRLELSSEGHRWYDLVRLGKAYEVLAPRGMQEYMVIWPIPIEEVDLVNDPDILPQNPGYTF